MKSGSKGKCFRFMILKFKEVEMPLNRMLQKFISKVDYAHEKFKKQ